MPIPVVPILIAMAVVATVLALGKPRRRALPPGARPPAPPPPAVVPPAGPARKTESAVGPYSPDTAARLAPALVTDLAQRGRTADRELVRAFQAAAGLAVDGAYGPETRGALRYWLEVAIGKPADVPNAHAGTGEVAYSPPDGVARTQRERSTPAASWPPVTGYDPNAAVFYAPLAADAVLLGRAYRTDAERLRAVRAFQLSAGIAVDGLYGPETHGALSYWLQQAKVPLAPPKTLYGSGTKTYRPRA